MAINQEIVDRYKAQGFYKYVEWNRKRGILVKVYEQKDPLQAISFESGTHDLEYDQKFEEYRAFFLTRKEAVAFMVNIGMTTPEVVQAFRMIDGMQVVFKHV